MRGGERLHSGRDTSRRRQTVEAAQPDLLLRADLRPAHRAIPDDRLLLMLALAHPAIGTRGFFAVTCPA